SGQAGIGKTALCRELAKVAHTRGDTVLYGHCDEELTMPYAPWTEALAQLVEHVPVSVLDAHVAQHGGDLARLVPGLARRIDALPAPTTSDPETERYRLVEAVTGLLARASGDRPIVL